MSESAPAHFDFALDEQVVDGTHVIAVSGEVDIFTAPELKRAMSAAIDADARAIVIDLTETHFLDSTGLGVLIGAVKRLRLTDGRMLIVNTEPSTAKTFQITGLDQIFEIVGDRQTALDRIRSAE